MSDTAKESAVDFFKRTAHPEAQNRADLQDAHWYGPNMVVAFSALAVDVQ